MTVVIPTRPREQPLKNNSKIPGKKNPRSRTRNSLASLISPEVKRPFVLPTRLSAVAAVAVLALGACSTQTTPNRGSTVVEESADQETYGHATAILEDIDQLNVRPLVTIMPAINEAVRLNTHEKQAIPAALGVEGLLSAKAANNLALARSIAERTRVDEMDPLLFGRYGREYLSVLLQSREHASVLQWAEQNNLNRRLPLFAPDDASSLLESLAISHETLGNYWEAAKIRYSLASTTQRSSRGKRAVEPDHTDLLWRDLLQLDIDEIKSSQSKTRSAELKSWLELAAIVRDPELSLNLQVDRLREWQARMDSAPGSLRVSQPRELGLLPSLHRERWERAVALLPLSGKLAGAGKAIQDGMLAAQLKGSDNALKLSFIDSNGRDTSQLLEQARARGADVIVGPLAKQKLDDLTSIRSPVPILALNYLEDAIMPANVTQFGLATEDEARELAKTLSAAEANRVLLLHSSRDWAVRAAKSFSANWEGDDNHLIREVLQSEQQYNDAIQRAFDIDQSLQRKSGLQSLFGKRLEFQTRRRQDIDAVVVFANARQLATIKPLLAYHYAGNIPVLTASQINGGQTRAELRDLNGTIFKDAPFLLKNSPLKKETAQRYRGRTQLQRLFAMGMDAYLLAQRLPVLMSIEQGPIEGATGRLQLIDQRFERKLDTALIAGSRVVPRSDASIQAQLEKSQERPKN